MTVVRSRTGLLAGLVGGLSHTLVVLLSWEAFGFESLVGTFPAEPLYVAYVLVGMLVVGIAAGVAAARRGFVSPVVVGVLLAGAGTATWLRLRGGATPVGPTALGWYVLLWPVTLVLAVGAGVVEDRRS